MFKIYRILTAWFVLALLIHQSTSLFFGKKVVKRQQILPPFVPVDHPTEVFESPAFNRDLNDNFNTINEIFKDYHYGRPHYQFGGANFNPVPVRVYIPAIYPPKLIQRTPFDSRPQVLFSQPPFYSRITGPPPLATPPFPIFPIGNPSVFPQRELGQYGPVTFPPTTNRNNFNILQSFESQNLPLVQEHPRSLHDKDSEDSNQIEEEFEDPEDAELINEEDDSSETEEEESEKISPKQQEQQQVNQKDKRHGNIGLQQQFYHEYFPNFKQDPFNVKKIVKKDLKQQQYNPENLRAQDLRTDVNYDSEIRRRVPRNLT